MSEMPSTFERGTTRANVLRVGGALMLVAGFAFSAAPAAGAAVAVVNTAFASPTGTGSACSRVAPCSATTAVDTAASGMKIVLAAGTYDTQLTVTTPGLTIQGKGAVTIRPTAVSANATKADGTTPVEAIIAVAPGTTGVAIANLTIDGSQADFPACTGTSFSGVEFHDASGSLSHVHVTNMVPASGITGCQVGDAVYVASTDGSANVSISHAKVDTYNKNGITCKGATTSCTVSSSTVIGTPTANIAQNGIQFSAGAGGSITSSNVSHNTNLSDCHCASGILLYQAGEGVSVSGSKVTSSDNNIYALGGTTPETNMFGLSITGTTSSNSTFSDGLTLDSVDSVTVSGDKFTGNAGYGIGVYGATSSVITSSIASKNVAAGIYLDGSGSFSAAATNNSVSSNTVKANQGPGIWANTGADQNVFQSNTMLHNTPDAQDAGVGNSWGGNNCTTSSPAAGLCQ